MIVKTKISKTEVDTEKVAQAARDLLEERFGDDFVFDPIVVEPRVFDDGVNIEDYLDIVIVYEGDRKNLDPGWIVTMNRLMEPALMDLGLEMPIVKGFSPKYEWEEYLREVAEDDRLYG